MRELRPLGLPRDCGDRRGAFSRRGRRRWRTFGLELVAGPSTHTTGVEIEHYSMLDAIDPGLGPGSMILCTMASGPGARRKRLRGDGGPDRAPRSARPRRRVRTGTAWRQGGRRVRPSDAVRAGLDDADLAPLVAEIADGAAARDADRPFPKARCGGSPRRRTGYAGSRTR